MRPPTVQRWLQRPAFHAVAGPVRLALTLALTLALALAADGAADWAGPFALLFADSEGCALVGAAAAANPGECIGNAIAVGANAANFNTDPHATPGARCQLRKCAKPVRPNWAVSSWVSYAAFPPGKMAAGPSFPRQRRQCPHTPCHAMSYALLHSSRLQPAA